MFASLENRVAVVTGASSGIGRAIAWEFAQAGCDLVIHYRRSEGAARQLARQIEQQGRVAYVLSAALEDNGARSRFVEDVLSLVNRVPDIWVNNAGADLLTGSGAVLPYAQKLEQLWSVDVLGTVELCRGIGRRMRAEGRGVILNVGWDQAATGMGGESGELFATAKNAIMGFTRSLSVSLAPEVRVNCIAPGWIRTAWGDSASDSWQQRVLQETPLGRWGEPEDIARLARFLVSDEAAYLTGQVINANGGAVR